LKAANPRSRFEPGDRVVVPAVGFEAPPARAASVRIDKSDRMLYLLDDVDRPVAAFPVSIGGPADELPLGRLAIENAARNPVFTYDAELLGKGDKAQRKVDIPAGPNNPVGVYWLGLSKPHVGIHGTPEPSLVGSLETSGGVHMTNWDVMRLAQVVKIGFVVDVHA
jgi:lipoprotein-anchoring transpeptidase ErfK/SrfK